MTQPPNGSQPPEQPQDPQPERPQDQPPERPQDQPHDPTRAFPTYGRPDQPPSTPWAAPGAQPPPGQPQPPYGQSPYGQPQPGQPQYGQPQYGQSAQGQPPYGPGAYGPAPYGHGYGPGQYPAAYGYGYTGGSGGTNALATAALVCALGGIFIGLSAPVGVALGITALVQLSRRPQAGKGMAIAGVVIGSLVSLGYVALIGLVIAFGSSGGDSGAPDPSAPDPGTNSAYIDELLVGECFNDTSADDQVERQPCPNEHDAELVAIVSLPAGTYPGDKAIDKAADQACTPPFGTYVGKSRDESELYLNWLTPDKYTWNAGDRRVFCVAYGPANKKLTGTVKNSHR
ncbi:DUF4190 domain-containing protein [Kribbella sp.]|uniref:DUF4190 domain-containing protein n=1 Tax=Kribbella sp. TaxID=1871183 RepID=UPI002D3E103E|nr:DUF4190 domain-containing protein [Kribbella sp.]HZX07022.1 DUF4190 domain-containing protein [Kribbella sp.]